MSGPSLDIAVLGDLHGCFDALEDGPLLEPYAVRLCTGDLAPNGGRRRFEEALRQSRELASLGVLTVLGNHDGPTCFTGRRFPKSYLALDTALGDFHLAGRRLDLPELDVSIVGARPLTFGATEESLRRHPVPGREEWTHARWAEEIHGLMRGATTGRIVVLAHDGPAGLGARRDDIYGCDFLAEEGDWGDPDLRAALDAASDLPVVAVVAGHMHHRLSGGGQRRIALREGGTLHLNAALVPRVAGGRRALFVLHLDGLRATARLEWHGAGQTVTTLDLEPQVAPA